jgi:hypothetical protein
LAADFETRKILSSRGLLRALLSLRRQSRAEEQALDESDVAERDGERTEANRLKAFDEETDDLIIAGDVVHPDQLRAHLKDFPSPPGVLGFIPEDRGPIGEPLGNSLAGQAHADRPRHLRRRIRTQQERPSGGAVDELVAGFEELRFQAGSQHIQIFKGGQDDLIVAPARHLLEEPRLDAADLSGGMRQNRRHPYRDERTFTRREHVPLNGARLRRSSRHGKPLERENVSARNIRD